MLVSGRKITVRSPSMIDGSLCVLEASLQLPVNERPDRYPRMRCAIVVADLIAGGWQDLRIGRFSINGNLEENDLGPFPVLRGYRDLIPHALPCLFDSAMMRKFFYHGRHSRGRRDRSTPCRLFPLLSSALRMRRRLSAETFTPACVDVPLARNAVQDRHALESPGSLRILQAPPSARPSLLFVSSFVLHLLQAVQTPPANAPHRLAESVTFETRVASSRHGRADTFVGQILGRTA